MTRAGRTGRDTKGDALVVFSPSGKRGRFPSGTTVLQAANELGVDIDSVCGGRGLCGRCQVGITEGELTKHGIVSSRSNVSAPSAAERQLADEQGFETGRRLSCLATIQGDLAIDVPATSQVHRQVIRKAEEARDIEIDPVVQAFLVTVDAPDLQQPDGDLQRLRRALLEQWKLDDLSTGLGVEQRLQDALREGDWQVTVAIRNGTEIIAVWPGLHDRLYGVAVDVGSTTVAAHLCNLRTGELLASDGTMNPQIRFGEDLMSRVSYVMSNPGSREEMTGVIRKTVSELVGGLASTAGIDVADVVEMTIVGNPIMHHLLLGISPVELGRAPFTLANSESVNVRASELDIAINPGGYAYVLPCIAGHVGADAAGVCLAEAPFDRDEISLIVDVGTNAEILLGNKDRLLAASSPTGPAFEGAQISAGQRAAPGAIERVRIDPETFAPRFKVIGCDVWSDDPEFATSLPKGGVTGICGSGIIEAIAEMYLAGVMDRSGRILGDQSHRSGRIEREQHTFSYRLHDGERKISILQSDVRAIQLAKASMYAGVELLMKRMGVEKVDRIRLAGAFGSQIDARYALVLGMIPECEPDAVSSAGNAAGTGARITLLNRQSRRLIEAQVRSIEKIETAAEGEFQACYVAAMAMPSLSRDEVMV